LAFIIRICHDARSSKGQNQKLIFGIEILPETFMSLRFLALSKACEAPTDIILPFHPFLWPSARLNQPDSRSTHFLLLWGFN